MGVNWVAIETLGVQVPRLDGMTDADVYNWISSLPNYQPDSPDVNYPAGAIFRELLPSAAGAYYSGQIPSTTPWMDNLAYGYDSYQYDEGYGASKYGAGYGASGYGASNYGAYPGAGYPTYSSYPAGYSTYGAAPYSGVPPVGYPSPTTNVGYPSPITNVPGIGSAVPSASGPVSITAVISSSPPCSACGNNGHYQSARVPPSQPLIGYPTTGR